MDMKLTATSAILAALLIHHLLPEVTPIVNHTTLDNSSPTGLSLPLRTNHSFRRGTDGFLHLQHSLQANMLLRMGDSSSAVDTTIQGLETDVTLEAYVGTSHGRQRYILKVDTSSIVTLIQCQPCFPYARQHKPIFDTNASPTYLHVPGTSQLCEPPFQSVSSGTMCAFQIQSLPGALSVNGFISTDHFATSHPLPNFLFGCAHSVQNFANLDTYAGVISIGRLTSSLTMQLTTYGLTKFSYCLFGTTETNRRGFLRFGIDIPRNPHYRTTRLMPALHANESEYYINLVGLSLGARRLDRIRPDMFAHRNEGQGGCMIDLSTPLTKLVQEAYHVVEEAVWLDLQNHNAQRVNSSSFSLCVRATKTIKGRLQSLSLHFAEEEAVLIFSPAQLFLMINDQQGQIACLAIMPGERTIIGAFQQVDTRFVYDIKDSKLSFASESCTGDTTQHI